MLRSFTRVKRQRISSQVALSGANPVYHQGEEKPELPYTIGREICATTHHPPDPPEEHSFSPSPEMHTEFERLHPVAMCLRHQPVSGRKGRGKIRLKVLGDIKTGDPQTCQLVKVRVVSADRSAKVARQDYVAKFYDPLYWDFEGWNADFFRGADSQYAHEVEAYSQLQPLQGQVVPRFYGAFSAEIPVPNIDGCRAVRFILLEHVPGKSLNRLIPSDYNDQKRQVLMRAIINADRALRQHDVIHGDMSPRNVMLEKPIRQGANEAKIRIIDFDSSTCGYLSELSHIPATVSGQRPLESRESTVEVWSHEHSGDILEHFGPWIEGWDWDSWLQRDYAP